MTNRAVSIATAVLRREVEPSAGPADAARAVEKAFARFYGLMMDVIGEGGFAALFGRALHLTRPRVPWLASLEPKLARDFELGGLREVFEKEGRRAGLAGAAQLLGCLLAVLFSLIGEDLTLRLIGRIWVVDETQAPIDSEET